ncbi:hypothetical protein ES703_98236 [subsurface metagenome]
MTSLKTGKRKGLSQVVTTLMILVISILMTTGTLTYYSMTVTSSVMKTEQLVIQKAHIWVNESGAQAAFQVENIGGRDALITSIEIQYIEEPWSDVFYACGSCEKLTPVQGLNITMSFVHNEFNFTEATGSLLLPKEGKLIIYVDQPNSIDVYDLGNMAHITVWTSAIQYLAFVDVEIA